MRSQVKSLASLRPGPEARGIASVALRRPPRPFRGAQRPELAVMAEDPKLSAEPRTKLGSAECRRLRRDQRVPGNVYGHGEEPASIAVAEEAISPIVHSGHKVVDLELGGKTEKAILREVQWDTFG